MRVVILIVKQEVLGFDISVADSVRVQVVESVEGLAHHKGSL